MIIQPHDSRFNLPTHFLNRNTSFVDIHYPVTENVTNINRYPTPICWTELANGAGYTAGQQTNNSSRGLANESILNAWGHYGVTDGTTVNFMDSKAWFTPAMVGQTLDIETIGSFTIATVVSPTQVTFTTIPATAAMGLYWTTSVYGFDKQPCTVSANDPSGQTIFYSILAGFPFSNPRLARKLIIDTRSSTTLPATQQFLANWSGLIDVKLSL